MVATGSKIIYYFLHNGLLYTPWRYKNTIAFLQLFRGVSLERSDSAGIHTRSPRGSWIVVAIELVLCDTYCHECHACFADFVTRHAVN